MADPNAKHSENAPGAWYVDDSCIHCGLCGEIAPDVFHESTDGVYYVVGRQPKTAPEVERAEEACDLCPVEAIGCEDGAAVAAQNVG